MNEHHPYDKWLGAKLRKLPVPDAEEKWPEMRRLLDQHLPEEEKGRSRRRGGWWFFSAILLCIIAGSWSLMNMNYSPQNVDPPLSGKRSGSPPAADQASYKNPDPGIKPVAHDDLIIHNEKNTDNILNVAAEASVNKTNPSAGNTSGYRSAIRRWADSGRLPGAYSATPAGRDNSINDASADPESIAGGNDEISLESAGNLLADILPLPIGQISKGYENATSTYTGYVQPKWPTRKEYRRLRKYGKPAGVRSPYTTNGRNFAIGIALPLGFPLGDQKMLGYNFNAGHNTVTDYIPSPHVQYHFNAKSYIQLELQLLSPQYIRPVLMHKDYYSNNNYSTTSSVYARKLYYLNVPVSVHYSPFKHFYLGTGLQFSSLLRGIAMHEQIRSGIVSSDSVYTTQYKTFSRDSISRKINGNELRLLLDANYYWNRFTVGLRYNQAFSNYINSPAAPSVPYTLDKNKSIQFYIRYNIWENKKNNFPGPRVFSLR